MPIDTDLPLIKNKLLVVLYEVSSTNSTTIQSIVDYLQTQDALVTTNYQLHIWDNSPKLAESDIPTLQAQLPALEIQYTHTPENRSLSKIYNQATFCLAVNEYLTLFDQDTLLPTSYFEELEIAQRNQWPLILPKVECQSLLVSPGKRFFAKGIRLKEINSGVINSKNLLAINSGMSILGKVFHSIQYDERLRFYGTDTYFMRNYEKYFDQAFVLDTPISHSLAEMEPRSDEWWIAQAKEKMRTFEIIFNNSLTEIVFVKTYSFGLRIKAWLSNFSRISS